MVIPPRRIPDIFCKLTCGKNPAGNYAQLKASQQTAGIPPITSKMSCARRDQLPNGRWIALIQTVQTMLDIPNCPAMATPHSRRAVEFDSAEAMELPAGVVWNLSRTWISPGVEALPIWTHPTQFVQMSRTFSSHTPTKLGHQIICGLRWR